MDNFKSKSFKYKSDNAKLIHNFLEKVLNERITKSLFSEEKGNSELIRKFNNYDNFKYLANRWLWETFFNYEEAQIKWMFALAKQLKSEYGSDSELGLIQLLIRSMSLDPPEKKKPEIKEKTQIKKESKPLTLDDLKTTQKEETEEEDEFEDEDEYEEEDEESEEAQENED
jgi:hypothetical protein